MKTEKKKKKNQDLGECVSNLKMAVQKKKRKHFQVVGDLTGHILYGKVLVIII